MVVLTGEPFGAGTGRDVVTGGDAAGSAYARGSLPRGRPPTRVRAGSLPAGSVGVNSVEPCALVDGLSKPHREAGVQRIVVGSERRV